MAMANAIPAPAEENIEFSVPAHFQRIQCCAYHCNLEDDDCLGIKHYSSFLCVDTEALCFKCIPDESSDKCCVFQASQVHLTKSLKKCRCYQQTCGLETYCALPGIVDGALFYKPPLKPVDIPVELTKQSFICAGCCCCLTICGYEYPLCLGYNRSVHMCCMNHELLACKPLRFSRNRRLKRKPEQCCLVHKYSLSCSKHSTTCCRYFEVCLCFDTRCSCPADPEVPCVSTCLPFCSVFAKGRCHCACCPQVKDLPGYVVPTLEHQVFEEGVVVHAVAVGANPAGHPVHPVAIAGNPNSDPFNPNNYVKTETI